MARRRRIYLFGGSFNPPGVHHRLLVEALREYCQGDDLIVIVPCGVRPDKQRTNDTDPGHRAAMVELALAGLPRVHIDFSDLEKDEFTRTWNLDARYRAQFLDTDIWHVVGADLVEGGATEASQIHTWFRGSELFKNRPFLLVTRGDRHVEGADFPRHCEVLDLKLLGTSTLIRGRCAEREPITELVHPAVESYIDRWHLYTGRVSNGRTQFQAQGPGIILAVPPHPSHPWPEREERVRRLVALAQVVNEERTGNADHIIVIGGDGWMLDTIGQERQRALPLIGLNAGTAGYLLNDGTWEELGERLHRKAYTLLREPLLQILFTRTDGTLHTVYAFNEGFLRSNAEPSGWMRVTIDGDVIFDRLMGDGLMLATAAGSTGWSKAKGGQPWWIGAPHMVLTGDATTFEGRRWVSTNLEDESIVQVDVLDTHKRPMRLVVDGKDRGLVTRVVMNRSHARSVEIGFFPETVRRNRWERIRNA